MDKNEKGRSLFITRMMDSDDISDGYIDAITTKKDKVSNRYGDKSVIPNLPKEEVFIERYRCECGKLMGKELERRKKICPVCRTKVTYHWDDVYEPIERPGLCLLPNMYEAFINATSEVIIQQMIRLDTYEEKINLVFDYMEIFDSSTSFVKKGIGDDNDKIKSYVDSIISSGYITLHIDNLYNNPWSIISKFEKLLDKFGFLDDESLYPSPLYVDLLSKAKNTVSVYNILCNKEGRMKRYISPPNKNNSNKESDNINKERNSEKMPTSKTKETILKVNDVINNYIKSGIRGWLNRTSEPEVMMVESEVSAVPGCTNKTYSWVIKNDNAVVCLAFNDLDYKFNATVSVNILNSDDEFPTKSIENVDIDAATFFIIDTIEPYKEALSE